MKLTSKILMTLTCVATLGLQGCAEDVASDALNHREIRAQAKNGGEVEVFRSEKNDEFYFRLKAANGEILLASEGYKSLGGVNNATQALKRAAQNSKAYDLRESRAGDSYFVVKANNGAVLAVSEMYASQSNALRGAETVMAYLKGNTMLDYWTDQCGFEMYTGNDDDTWFRLRANNGEPLLKGEGYSSEAAAKTGIDTVVTTSIVADDSYGEAAYVIFEGEDGQFYWNLQADNREIVASGGEGFSSRSAAHNSVALVQEHAQDEIECWTTDEGRVLTTGEDGSPTSGVVGTVDDTFIGEIDPFVVGDVCIMYVSSFDTGKMVGILDEFCDYTLEYAELLGFAVEVVGNDLRPVTAAEDRELQDYLEADYFWLDGSVNSIE